MAARTLAAAREAGLEATVWFTPGDAGPEMRYWLGEGWRRAPAGVRAISARGSPPRRARPTRAGLARAGWANAPESTPRCFAKRPRSSARGDLVLGPTDDGGYYLIGGVPPLPDVFTAMPWGSDRLLAETRTRLAHVGASWRELRSLTLVETIEHARAEGLLT